MLLSIIVPVFNEEKNIGILIEKLLQLDFSEANFHKEIIVVNDGSNDGSREIIEKFDKIQVVNQENLGKGRAVQNKNYVVNLLPYTSLTKEIFNKKIFSKMEKNAFFINVGRGETVNEFDLIKALKKKLLLGAALDVVQNEPIKINSKLLKLNNLIVTPHIAGITKNYWNEQYKLFFNNFVKFKRSKKLQNLVKSEIGY